MLVRLRDDTKLVVEITEDSINMENQVENIPVAAQRKRRRAKRIDMDEEKSLEAIFG